MSKYKIILLIIYPNSLSYKALPGNTIYEMKLCFTIDGVFKLFEIVVLAYFYDTYSRKSKKKLLYFYSFFVFEEKDHGMMSLSWHDAPCIIYLNIKEFMQSKLKE